MKKPDINDLKGKFSLNKIMDTINDVVDSAKGGAMDDVDPSDAIGSKIAQIDKLVCDMREVMQKHANQLGEIDTLLKGLYKDLNALPGTDKQPAEQKSDSVNEQAVAADDDGGDDALAAAQSESTSEGEDTAATSDELDKKDDG